MILEKFKLTDRVAIVTGAGRGIGKAISLALGEAGADLVCVARTAGEIEATAAEVRAMGRRALPIRADVRDSQQIEDMFEMTLGTFGRVDILVNNAGSTFIAPVMEMSQGGWEAVMTENLTSCFLCSRTVARKMIEQKSGCVVNISSGVALTGGEGLAHYGAAKAGMMSLTKTLAREWARHNIRVNCIAVGTVLTDLARDHLTSQASQILPNVLRKRFGEPEDIAAAALYLASDASDWVTGKIFEIDGGMR